MILEVFSNLNDSKILKCLLQEEMGRCYYSAAQNLDMKINYQFRKFQLEGTYNVHLVQQPDHSRSV